MVPDRWETIAAFTTVLLLLQLQSDLIRAVA